MGRAWVKTRKKDPYYRRAKAEGYPSRAAYKLREASEKFALIRPGDTVIDLGASPGGWSQAALELVGTRGRVVAIDMVTMRPPEGVIFLKGDVREEVTIAALLEAVPDRADVLISDMAPRLSGNRSLDQSRSLDLAQTALEVTRRCLRPGGNLLVKLFQGDQYEDFRKDVSREFRACKGFSPKASPARSSEIYLVAKGYRGPEEANGSFMVEGGNPNTRP